MEKVLLGIVLIGALIFAIRKGIPGSHTGQGYSHQDRGEYEAEEQCFLRALSFEKAMQRVTGQRIGVALQYSNLGLLYHQWRRTEDAIKMFVRAIAIYSDLGDPDSSAPVYTSLGKAYFDNGDLHPAEEALSKALMIYRRRHNAREAISTTNQLLDAISARKETTDAPRNYKNIEYAFSFTIPPEWERRPRSDRFLSTGGQIAISHKTLNATFNVSVGPLDPAEWRAKDVRARAVVEFLTRTQGDIESIDVTTSAPIAREPNTVSAKYETHRDIRSKAGLISILHNGLEYSIQWLATPEYEDQVKAIVVSFRFEK